MRLPIGSAEFARDRSLVLDGEVGDAAPRIELVGRRKGVRRAGVEAGAARAAMVGLGRVGLRVAAVVKMAPRKSQEPNSRLTRFVCLPCQPMPAASASGFSMTGAVSTNTFTSPPGPRRDLAGQFLQPALDDVVIVAVARIDRDRAAVRHAGACAGRRPGRSSCRARRSSVPRATSTLGIAAALEASRPSMPSSRGNRARRMPRSRSAANGMASGGDRRRRRSPASPCLAVDQGAQVGAIRAACGRQKSRSA
jgi:hypothetical protein